MPSLIVSENNQRILSENRIGYGSYWMSSRSGGYETYAVRLSAEAAAVVENGDIIEFGRGRTDWCVQDAGGKIIKTDGTIYHLTGYADIGIDTGHPPHLSLKKVEKWGICWETIDYVSVIFDQEAGAVYRDRLLNTGEWDLDYYTVVENCDKWIPPHELAGSRWVVDTLRIEKNPFRKERRFVKTFVNHQKRAIKKLMSAQNIVEHLVVRQIIVG